MQQIDTTLPIEVFAMSQADRDAAPEVHRAFRRTWGGLLAGISPRVVYDAFFALTPPASGVSLHPSTDPAVPGWVCVPDDRIEDQALPIQAGSDEILYDDALRYAREAHARGHDVTLQEWSGMQHVFQQSVAELEAARQALDHAAAFFGRHMGNP